jgi:hypothetical protein
MFRRRNRPVSGRGAGPETLDDLTIEAPDGPAGVIVGEARKRMRRDGTVPEDDDGEGEREASADPPADQPGAVEQTAGRPVGQDTDTVATQTVAAVKEQGQQLGALLTLAHRLAQTPDDHKEIDEVAARLLAAGERQEILGRVLLGLVRQGTDFQLRPLAFEARGLPRRVPRATLLASQRDTSKSRPRPAPAPPPPVSPSGAQLLPPPTVGESRTAAVEAYLGAALGDDPDRLPRLMSAYRRYFEAVAGLVPQRRITLLLDDLVAAADIPAEAQVVLKHQRDLAVELRQSPLKINSAVLHKDVGEEHLIPRVMLPPDLPTDAELEVEVDRFVAAGVPDPLILDALVSRYAEVTGVDLLIAPDAEPVEQLGQAHAELFQRQGQRQPEDA